MSGYHSPKIEKFSNLFHAGDVFDVEASRGVKAARNEVNVSVPCRTSP